MRELTVGDTTWISLSRPTDADIRSLRERFPEIHPAVLEDLASPTIRPSDAERYDDHLYLVLHFPDFNEQKRVTVANELDIIMMPRTLITVHYDDIPVLEKFWQEREGGTSETRDLGKTPVHLFHALMKEFFSFSRKELDQIQSEIDSIERKVFSGREKEILTEVAVLRRNIVDFRRAVKPQHLTLEALIAQGGELFGEKTKPLFADLVGEYLRVWNLLENHKEALDALYETNNALLAAKSTEIMRVFTILAFITFIPAAVANIYGMNLPDLPFADRENAFWAVLVLMAVATLLVYLVLKWRKLV